jgi:hypothetical protein
MKLIVTNDVINDHAILLINISINCLQITEELESVKAQMDERGTNMTDAGIV